MKFMRPDNEGSFAVAEHDTATPPSVGGRRARFIEEVRPEAGAGGFARDDGIVGFYTRVNALLTPEMTVLDLGAGRGSKLWGPQTFVTRLVQLQGKVQKVIGIDVDDAITQHPHLDERHVVKVGDTYPLASGSIDLIVCEWVLEHVADPQPFADEIARVLKPGGWFCARTPAKWSYVGIAARLVPNRLHTSFMSRLWPEREAEDVFPTVYRLNTKGALRRYFPDADWRHYGCNVDGPPKYHANNKLLFGMFDTLQKLTPAAVKTEMIVLLQKRA